MAEKKQGKSKEDMAASIKMEEFSSETVGVEAELEVKDEPGNNIEAQLATLLKELGEERKQRVAMAEQLAQLQRNATALPVMTDGQAPKLANGREWGPFPDYEFATTPFGEYAIPLEKVLYFVGVQQVDKETLQLITVPVPQYRDATEEELTEIGSPSMQPLRKDRIKPPVTVEEAMTKMVEFFEGRSAPGLSTEPIVATEVQ